jgi:uncharacterized protein (DUF362 family)
MDRRTFIKGLGLGLTIGGVGLSGAQTACSRDNKRKVAHGLSKSSRVVVARNDRVRNGGQLVGAQVERLLENALGNISDGKNATQALKGIISSRDIVGVKMNCLAGPPLSPSKELVDALAKILVGIGVPASNIIFFERGERDIKKGGFQVRTSGRGPLFVGNDSPGAGYEKDPQISGQVGSCLSKILTRRISVMINLGVLKDHNLAGVGVGMKNLFGVIHNPNKYHDNGCSPYVADVLAFPVIQKKMRLTIIDGLTAQCHGGPAYMPEYAWPFNGLLVSTDPVALDRVAWQILDKQRRKVGLKSLTEEKREPQWIFSAANRKLGVSELAKIEIREIT